MRVSTITTALVGIVVTVATFANAQDAAEAAVAGLATAIRKEVREMSEDEWTTYANAVKLVQETGFWKSMADIHADNFRRGIHNGPMFFPWHRAYLRVMEDQLSTVAKTTVTIPYWDWTLDSADMNGSPIFGSNRFGGFSRDRSSCVTDGPFKTLSQPASFGPERCLRRGRGYRGNGYDRVAVLRRLQNSRGTPYVGSRDYENVRYGIEMIHNSVHSSIRGDMGGLSSPLDPIFYSHHMMIDNLWSVWQARDPANMLAYQGATDQLLMALDGYTVNDTFAIRPFKPLEDTVASTADIASRLAARAGDGMEPVEFSTSESVKMLNALGAMDAKQLDQVPRTCAAPLRGEEGEMFWDAEGEEPLIAEMEARFKLAQKLGLPLSGDCLASPEVIQRVINGEDLEGSSDKAALGVPELAAMSAGGVGLVAIVAGVIVSRRNKNNNQLEATVDQHQLSPGEAFPEL
jgi:tyrosinase